MCRTCLLSSPNVPLGASQARMDLPQGMLGVSFNLIQEGGWNKERSVITKTLYFWEFSSLHPSGAGILALTLVLSLMLSCRKFHSSGESGETIMSIVDIRYLNSIKPLVQRQPLDHLEQDENPAVLAETWDHERNNIWRDGVAASENRVTKLK